MRFAEDMRNNTSFDRILLCSLFILAVPTVSLAATESVLDEPSAPTAPVPDSTSTTSSSPTPSLSPEPTTAAEPAVIKEAPPAASIEKTAPNPPQSSAAQDSLASSSKLSSPDSSNAEEEAYRDLRIPKYQLVRPSVAVSLDFSPLPFGGTALTAAQRSNSAMAFTLGVQWQPQFIQSLGVIGIGPVFGVYPISGGVTSSIFSIASIGGRATYQLRYFRNQPIVPVVSYQYEYLYYDFLGSPVGYLWSSGPSAGLWFLISLLEPSVASSAYISTGISRTYAVVEFRRLTGASSDGSVAVSGNSWYFGLRFEF